ncbi:dolichyl-diphosphooligosaccharide--protein glycosyltransferase [Haladaptatus litoreus]|uniref:dolichyl-phosphooligosaccharide-protein glycotransferase n=1 Tax=Haladaptatus litoreus TaxID=553468 RepID=A0A1N6YSQ4_9EURY|nr:oligosaccharyl transferase, archaeosortase A system-associated [Haladaptatus litoreus]SIR17635.1 dolichyl-diphosphooligosaccharide--protein glycosyltransferase [Haladaptatus litoreus]
MSQGTEQVEESSNLADSVLDQIEDWYHIPALALLLGFMLWVRLQSYDRFTRNGEVFFAGNDAWYHLRQVQYTVNNWPATMPFDPWTYYPQGTSVGQFGTLYDQLVATAALIVGLGDPSQQTVALTLLVAPAVFGTLVAVPTYFVGKRLGGRLGGVFGVLVLALIPGEFLRRGLVGFADHNVVEPFFQTLAVLAMMVAVSIAERERPVFELLADRDFAAVRRPLGYSVLAGVATALYLWTWPPGILLIGIFGVFFMLKLTADYVRGISPDHLAFVASVSMGVTGLLLLVPLGTISFSATKFSILQPLMAFAVSIGAGFMTWLAREWDDRDVSPMLYPVAIFGILGIGTLLVYVALPNLFNLIQTNLVRFVGFNAGAAQRTIGEAQPFLQGSQSLSSAVIPQYGLMFFTAILGALVMVWRAVSADEHEAEKLLVLVWAAFITAAAFTQVRFNYYLAVPVAVLNAYLLGWILGAVGFDSATRDTIRNVEMYQVLAVVFVVMLVIPGLVMPVQVGNGQTATAAQTGNSTAPGAVTQWDGTLEWMQTNTPQEGNYGGAGNSMEYYGTYTEGDGDYDYPEGSYGVMSWWDYGHWITVEGERIPNANPFQEGATTAANYLLAQNESEANEVLNNLGDENEQTKYVMVDWKMVETNGQPGNVKFFAPTVFKDDASAGDYYDSIYTRQSRIAQHKQPYYDSQMVRLYRYHGSAVEPRPIVLDWKTTQGQDGQPLKVAPSALSQNANDTVVKRFDTMQEARKYVREDGSAQIGGIGPYPSERIPAMEHYRVVKESQSQSTQVPSHYQVLSQRVGLLQQAGVSTQDYFRTSPSWVKTFERVEGATVEGTGPANTNITASVRMQTDTGSAFTYTQMAQTDENGEFTMTLPYSTTGYDQWGTDEGYTNVSVRATGPYEFRTPQTAGEDGFEFTNGTAQVSEAQVLGEDDSPVTVSVDQQQTIPVEGANNSTGNNSAGPSDPGNQTGDNSSAGNGSVGNNSTGNESNSLPGPASPLTRGSLVGAYAATLVIARRD